ncbi:NAD(P)/FAD-dependent oxidoreductase [Roseibium aggregatum]|uniref:FAD-binding oxidoreductase n=1 Tax=Roseibium aggregatum TaxID=187304 RepID=A0A939EGL9_9HYPH|nr:FAD-binding oxidoreductase [Roseibium aggregatum]MBN9672589.1 FAD-binding oxidoreductase [Roseibium aggregatum]
MAENLHDIIVIGGGVVGVSAALALQGRGHEVLVLDRPDETLKASQMNAGAFAFCNVEPLATPGIMRKAPKWLVDPLGPLSVPPAYALNILPWMLRFWRASWPDRYRNAVNAQAAMMKHCQEALRRQVGATSGEPFLQPEGQLQLYEGEREYRASLAEWDLRKELGIPFELLESPEAIAAFQPGLDSRFTHAGFTPDWTNTVDPKRWHAHLSETFLARGGRIERAEVTALTPQDQAVRVKTASEPYSARKVVVSAGAWSHHVSRSLGEPFPLETERGYNTTLPPGAFDLKTHLTFSGHGFVVSRINDGIRVGGAVELGGLKLAPNYRRANVLLQKAKTFLPDLKTEGGSQWMGYRPTLPDSLPVIDRSPRDRRVIYAFGHGHLGMTQSAGTGELVAALVHDEQPAIDLGAFSARRF